MSQPYVKSPDTGQPWLRGRPERRRGAATRSRRPLG